MSISKKNVDWMDVIKFDSKSIVDKDEQKWISVAREKGFSNKQINDQLMFLNELKKESGVGN